jgi:asparagine synthase (glutamine-hydrolysing)
MSAIAGILRFDGAPVSRSDLERQLGTMAHRGPDRRRVWRDGLLGLGHALRRMTHEDDFDDQPLIERGSSLSLVADLRLDNRAELSGALGIGAVALARLSDSALLMECYKAWGEDCASRLLGDFAFAVWDGRARKLVLARDHMGIRSVHYHVGKDFFAFATEAKGLWTLAEVPRRIDEFELGKRLLLDLTDSRGETLFEGITGLPGGTVMSIAADGAITSRRYWLPHADPIHRDKSETYYVETYRRILAEAVECRIRRLRGRAGLFFSGGFDSTSIAALSGPLMRAKGERLVAASSVMPGGHSGPPEDARAWVEAASRHMPHLDVRYVTREGYGFLKNLEATFLRRDSHSSPNRFANDAIYAALIECGVSLVMDGHGGDGTLNPTGNGWLAAQLREGRMGLFLRELAAYRRVRRKSLWKVLRQEVIAPLLPIWLGKARRRAGTTSGVIAAGFADYLRARGGRLGFGIRDARERTGANARLGLLLTMQDAAQCPGEAAAAACGLEYAMPFRDKRVVEFALAVPSRLFVRDGRDRYLARAALKGLLPPEFDARFRKGTDDRIPDAVSAVEREREALCAEIARMEKSPRLRRIFAFDRMREMLAAQSSAAQFQTNSRLLLAVRAVMIARYVEWFERANEFGASLEETDAGSRAEAG